MVFHQKLLVTAMAAILVAGCSSNSSDKKNNPSSSSVSSVSSVASSSSSSASSVAQEKSFLSCASSICTIKGAIDENVTLTADNTYILSGFVRVGNGNQSLADMAAVNAEKAAGVTLTIEPGTHIRAADDGVLLVTRGSKIMAEGTAAQPITFSSATDDDFDGEGEWGGVVIQGLAPQYGAGDTGVCYGTGDVCNVAGEGGDNIGFYAGNDPADNSGSLKYVRIAEAGRVAGPNNEINGLTLQGVGHGTQIDYVQVHGNLDDGIEWFGGTVNVTHAVLTNNDDDDLDFDEGYQGNIQHVIIRKHPSKAAASGSNDPRAIEANSSAPDQVSATEAVLANITVIGSKLVVAEGILVGQDSEGNDLFDSSQPAFRLRGDVTTQIWNSAVSGYGECVRIDSGDNTLVNFLGACTDKFYNDKTAGAGISTSNSQEIVGAKLALDAMGAVRNPEAQLSAAPAVIPAVDNGSGFDFEETDYIGAVDPDSANSERGWWAGWTIPGSLDGIVADKNTDFVSCTGAVCTISGTIDSDYVLTPDVSWVLDGFTTVGAGNVTLADDAAVSAVKAAGATLTLQPGVHVQAMDDGVLLVTRGSKIMAVGSAAYPITFSSAMDANYDGEGEWGGVVVQGFAPQYGAGDTGVCYGAGSVCNVAGEGGDNIGFYAGNEPGDSSGALKYVRIAEGGLIAGPNNEINGLTLQGVGHGTVLDYIQVHSNLDDGIEWFGGTANLTHAVLTSNDDDDIDFDEGYQGNMQHVLIRKNPTKQYPSGSNDPRGVEANSSSPDQVSATQAVLANFTIIGSDLVVAQGIVVGQDANGVDILDTAQPALRLRGDVNTHVWNTAVSAYGDCYRIDSGDNVFANFIGSCLDNFEVDKTGGAGITKTNVVAETGGALQFDDIWAVTNATASLNAAPEAIVPVDNGSGFDFEETAYMGAVNPDATQADRGWWAGWVLPGTLDK